MRYSSREHKLYNSFKIFLSDCLPSWCIAKSCLWLLGIWSLCPILIADAKELKDSLKEIIGDEVKGDSTAQPLRHSTVDKNKLAMDPKIVVQRNAEVGVDVKGDAKGVPHDEADDSVKEDF